ncbi:MAG TPA: hypothetical protein VGF41_07450 [Myxococcaceae bacterium]
MSRTGAASRGSSRSPSPPTPRSSRPPPQYFFTPEVIAEVSEELGVPHRTNGTISGCIRPFVR